VNCREASVQSSKHLAVLRSGTLGVLRGRITLQALIVIKQLPLGRQLSILLVGDCLEESRNFTEVTLKSECMTR
jgi:hypothetical protein